MNRVIDRSSSFSGPGILNMLDHLYTEYNEKKLGERNGKIVLLYTVCHTFQCYQPWFFCNFYFSANKLLR
jgi:hypothetical protein